MGTSLFYRVQRWFIIVTMLIVPFLGSFLTTVDGSLSVGYHLEMEARLSVMCLSTREMELE